MSWLPDFITQETPEFPEHITLKHSKRAKRLALRMHSHTGTFDLVIPPWASLHDAYRFMVKNEGWIAKQQARAPQITPLQHGQIIPLLGQDRTITINRDHPSARTRFELTDTEIILHTKLENPAPRLEKELKAIAKQSFLPLCKAKASAIEKSVTKLTLRDPKSRWGSCSADGQIMLSWRLIFAPHSAMDYVIAHEVAHLQHLDHSPAFWSLCETLSTDFTSGSSWMKKHGNKLFSYTA